MILEDNVAIPATREQVWTTLLDPNTLRGCLPGVERVEIDEMGAFDGVASLGIGASRLRVPIRVEWLEQDAPHRGRLRAVLRVAGQRLTADGVIRLDEKSGGTMLSWQVEAKLPGPLQDNPLLLQIGRQVATRFISEFFDCLQTTLTNVDSRR